MSGSPASDPPAGHGGLVVIIRDRPADAARVLASDLEAELAVGGQAAMLALDRVCADASRPVLDLDQLAASMRRAEQVRDRTRASAAQQVARSLNTDLAIHPETLHRAASELLHASNVRALAVRGRIESSAATRLRWIAAAAIVVAGCILAGLGELFIGLGVAALGVTSALVAFIATSRAAKASVPSLQAHEDVARRRWEQLAGVDADPRNVEAVVYRYDPRQRMVADLVGHHPAVRAAERAARIHRNAWVAAWCDAVGDTIAPPPTEDPLEQERTYERAVKAADRAKGPTLVVAAPYAALDDDTARKLHHRMLTLPPGPRVIVVLGPDSNADRPPTLDLTAPTAAIDVTDQEATVDLVEADRTSNDSADAVEQAHR